MKDVAQKDVSFGKNIVNWVVAVLVYTIGFSLLMVGTLSASVGGLAAIMLPITAVMTFFSMLIGGFIGIIILFAINGFIARALGGKKNSVLQYGAAGLNVMASLYFWIGILSIVFGLIGFVAGPAASMIGMFVMGLFGLYGLFLTIELTKNFFGLGWGKAIVAVLLIPIILLIIAFVLMGVALMALVAGGGLSTTGLPASSFNIPTA